MTLRVIEGFDFMTAGLSAAERARRYGAKGYYNWNNGLDVATGRFSFGKAMRLSSGIAKGTYGSKIPIGATKSDGYAGIAVYVGSGVGAYVGAFLSFFDGLSDAAQITVLFWFNGIVQVWRGMPDGGAMIIQTSVGAFQEDQYFYAEARCKVGTSDGVIEVRINTKTVISVPAGNTKGTANSTYDMVAAGVQNFSPGIGLTQFADYGLDDLYYCDTDGSVNNSFLGNCRVKTQFVTGNSTPQNFAIGGSAPAATAWQSLLNLGLDDTKYIYDGTAGDRSLFTIEAIINAPMVFATQLSIAARMDDATQRVLGTVMKSGPTVMSGDDHYTNQTFTFYKDIREINAATGVGFTGAELNALLVGPNVNV